MKLNENTLPVNKQLLEEVTGLYEKMFSSYKRVLSGTPIQGETYDDFLMNKGGLDYIKKLYEKGSDCVFLPNEPLGEMINLNLDKILSRRFKMSAVEFRDVLDNNPDAKITLTFWVNNQALPKSKEARGAFTPRAPTPNNDEIKNIIQIRFPYGREAMMPGIWKHMKPTIRHELQHFTQSFYVDLLGTNKWIGLPPPHTFKKQNDLFTSTTGKHEDIPVEAVTDVQDEIDYFMRDIYPRLRAQNGYIHRATLRNEIFDYIGIGIPAMSSNVFRHYFETNKDLWKWAVSKLLSAIRES